MTEYLAKREALERIVGLGIEPVLVPTGFAQTGKLNWVRNVGELQHVVALLSRRDSYDVQWGVVSHEVTSILWGPQVRDRSDVGYSAMSGTPNTIRHPPACQSFQLSNENDEQRVADVAQGISEDMAVVEERLRSFTTRRELREYLLENRDVMDRRDFIVPAGLPLKLLTAAALAIADKDVEAEGLAADAEQYLARYTDPLVVERIGRLRLSIAATKDS